MKRNWIPRRFSLRTLLFLVAFTAIFMAIGPWTRRGKLDVIEYNVARNGRMMQSTELIAPFIFKCQERTVDAKEPFTDTNGDTVPRMTFLVDKHRSYRSTYYLWLFGYVAQLPITTDGKSETFDQKTRQWVID